MTLAELIAALEQATGPDRAVDFWCWWWGKASHDGTQPDRDYIAANIRRNDAPRYTASIDAALTLVPRMIAPTTPAKQWPATVDLRRHDDGRGWAAVRATDATPDGADDELFAEANANTPALALCIAALKAREARDG